MATQKKVTILFIEDEDLLRSLFSETFAFDHDYEYRILSATDLKTGLERARKENPDLIVLDLILPYDKSLTQNPSEMSEKMGISLLKTLKQDAVTKKTPVVIFSNLGDAEIKKATSAAGAVEHLTKSETSPEHFLSTIKALLKKQV